MLDSVERDSLLLHKLLRDLLVILSQYVVPAAKRVGADLLEFAVSETADVVNGREKFKAAARSDGKQILRKQLGSGSRKRKAAIERNHSRTIEKQLSRASTTKPAKESSRSR